jgi:hypothetical protein
VGETDGRPFFSLEFVDGGSLEDQFGGKPMAWRPATELLRVLSRAVHAAHTHGIIHRDLKPANILLAANGTPKITDFGIAKHLDAVKQTQTGQILGTPCYMSPEQAKGDSAIGPATDVYALGAILYDALTGRPPFESDNTIDTIMQVLTRDPVSPRELSPTVPRDLDVICMKCLEKAPERRYATALELAEDLDRVLRNEAIRARPIGPFERALRWARRNPAWATLATVSALALAALLVTGAWFTHELELELRATKLARQEATDARNELRVELIRSKAAGLDGDLQQLADVPRTFAATLEQRSDWSERQLRDWVRSVLEREPHIFGMAVAFEPGQFRHNVADFSLYVFRGPSGIEAKQLLPPDYTPIYREWDWYRQARKGGSWSKPYVDEGGGNIPMVTFSMPFERNGAIAGVITADLSLDYFRALEESMRNSRFGGKSYVFVTTSDGTIVSHPNPQLRFPSPRARQETPADPTQATLWKRILAGEAGGAAHGVDITTGKRAELLFAPVQSSGWSCVAVVPEDRDLD